MITDQQFIDAMQVAVTETPNKVAVGQYRDYTGNPCCIVGAALGKINSGLVPWDNRLLAFDLLTELGCSERVAMAAEVAQNANDYHVAWDKVGTIFEKALSLYRPGMMRGDLIGALAPVIQQARIKTAAMGLAVNAGSLTGSFASITFHMDVSNESFKALEAALMKPIVATKQDHALVA